MPKFLRKLLCKMGSHSGTTHIRRYPDKRNYLIFICDHCGETTGTDRQIHVHVVKPWEQWQ